jgi:tryptophan synthase alpha chain
MSGMPVCVGFGVKTASQAREVAQFADGVVIGSHFVSQIPQADDPANIRTALFFSAKQMRQAVAANG